MMRAKFKSISYALLKRPLSLVLLASVLFTPSIHADEKAIELLNRMNHAVHKLNYSGTLAYLKDSTLSSLLIKHTVDNGIQTEHIVRLNDEGNELELSREMQDFSFSSVRTIRPEMEKVYSFVIGRENRIANIPCRIIIARPKDRDRYLQKYCIDPVTGMLLNYILVGKSRLPVEQFKFTSINISIPEGSAADDLEIAAMNSCANAECPQDAELIKVDGGVKTAIVDQGVAKTKQAPIVAPGAVKKLKQISASDLGGGWEMKGLPVGYEISKAPVMKMVKTAQSNKQDSQAGTNHIVISDGLSSISVFISPFTNETDFGAVKINSGALNVVSQRKGSHVITAVGEVPEETLHRIIHNLRKK